MKVRYTAKELLEFCETKPANEGFNYVFSSTCAIAQFLQSRGEEDFNLHSEEIEERFGVTINAAVIENSTFGDLARRLRLIIDADREFMDEKYAKHPVARGWHEKLAAGKEKGDE